MITSQVNRFWFLGTITLLLLVIMRVPTQAQDGGLIETFDDPTLPGWEYAPEVTVAEGMLRVPAPGFAFHPGMWHDLDLTIQVRVSGMGEILLSYCASEGENYHVTIGPEYLILQREADGTITEMGAAAPLPIPIGQWFQVGVIVTDGQHTLTLDGATVLTVTDPNPLPPGGIGIGTVGEVVGEFDDLVLGVSGEAPAVIETAPMPETSPLDADQLTWVRTGGPPGGLGYDIRYNFGDPNIWYATDNYAGVHISTDNGRTWQPSDTGIPPQAGLTGDSIPIFSLTVDPHNPQIVWAGTDKTGHIYKSTDGGRTWAQRDNGVTIGFAEGALTFRGFTIDPRTSDIVYAMGELEDLALRGAEVWSNGVGGVVYKTTDGGENWELIWDGGIPSSLARYMWIDPRDPNVLYVSTGIHDRGAVNEGDPETDPYPFGGLGILKSTDGGETWRILNEVNGLNFLYIPSLYMHPDEPDTLLACASKGVTDLSLEYMRENNLTPMGIYRTTDGGETWTQVLTEGCNSVELCPSDPNIAYAGNANAVYRSEDAGQTWMRVTSGEGWGPPGVLAGVPIDMQCDPRDTNRVFANNYLGGNFLSEDGGQTWQNASDGYTGAQILAVDVNPQNPAQVYAAGRMGIWRSDDGGATWFGIRNPPPDVPVWGGEWAGITLDPTNPSHVLTSEETIWESIDGGASWQVRHTPGPMLGSAIIFAPSNSSTVYAGGADTICMLWHVRCPQGRGVYVSHDGGTEWELASDANLADLSILDLAVDPTNDLIVYAGTEQGLFKTADGGASWALVSGLPEATPVFAVTTNPSNSQNILVGVEGMSLYLSSDGGQTWQAVVAGLEANSSIHDIVFDPTNSQVVYVSDLRSGVYRSTDGGHSWVKINNGLRTRATTGMAISADGQHLYVGTHGEGVFRLDVNSMPPQSMAG